MKKTERWLTGIVFLYLLGIFIGSFVLLGLIKMGLFSYIAHFDQVEEYIFYALAGAIGGTLYCLRLFYWHSIRRNLQIDRWWIWYVLRPIISSGTSIMTVLLLQSGILILEISKTDNAKIGLSFLVGYGFGKVMDKLESLTVTLFNGNSTKGQHTNELNK